MNDRITEYLNLIYNATNMPVHYFKGEDCVSAFPANLLPGRYIYSYRKALLSKEGSFHYFATDECLYIGAVQCRDTDEYVVIGPVSTIPVREEAIRTMITKYALENETGEEQVREFFHRTPSFTLYQFLSILSLIHKEMNGMTVDVLSLYRDTNSVVERRVDREHSNALMERKENEAFHDSYYFEQAYYGLLEKGDVSGLTEMMKSVPQVREGAVASNSLRQAKNIFIASITLATRHAIRGGLDIETAYQLSDSYIQEAERMTDTAAITFLNGNAIFDFTRRVAEAKIPAGMSPEIFRCIQYIANRVNQEITVDMIARELNMDRSTLSKKFKRELGFNISSFIMRRKLEEAKSLLHFTDKTVSEISEYLCFSTQSYFQNVFKKKYGMTPREYRRSVVAFTAEPQGIPERP